MEQRIFKNNGQKIAEIISDQIEISSVQDALDWMATANFDGADNIIFYEQNLTNRVVKRKT